MSDAQEIAALKARVARLEGEKTAQIAIFKEQQAEIERLQDAIDELKADGYGAAINGGDDGS